MPGVGGKRARRRWPHRQRSRSGLGVGDEPAAGSVVGGRLGGRAAESRRPRIRNAVWRSGAWRAGLHVSVLDCRGGRPRRRRVTSRDPGRARRARRRLRCEDHAAMAAHGGRLVPGAARKRPSGCSQGVRNGATRHAAIAAIRQVPKGPLAAVASGGARRRAPDLRAHRAAGEPDGRAVPPGDRSRSGPGLATVGGKKARRSAPRSPRSSCGRFEWKP